MKRLLLLVAVILVFACNSQVNTSMSNSPLFIISKGNRFGLIDSTGRIVVEPVFRGLGEFSEGLAPANDSGYYGFIDRSGKFIIRPQFDYATSFHEGLAIAHVNGKPCVIDKKGRQAFTSYFAGMQPYDRGISLVKTASGKCGAINKRGKLIVDTLFKRLELLSNGLLIATGLNHQPYPRREEGIKIKYEIGIVDTLGKFIVPFGKITELPEFNGSYFKVELAEEPWDTIARNTSRDAILDGTGKIIIEQDHQRSEYMHGNMQCGLVSMKLRGNSVKSSGEGTYKSNVGYIGFCDEYGNLVINDPTIQDAYDFSCNRAFIERQRNNYSIINRNGQEYGKQIFDDVLGKGFKNGFAFVEINGKWGLIDTNAQFVIQPRFKAIHYCGLIDDYFFFQETNKEKPWDTSFGIARTDGTVLVKPIIQEFDIDGFKHGLLQCVVEDRLVYLNKSGRIVWREFSDDIISISALNVDHMLRGHFFAYSEMDRGVMTEGGWSTSSNLPQNGLDNAGWDGDSLKVHVVTSTPDTFMQIYKGLPVYILNGSKDTIDFNAQDSRLNMKVQALNSKGEWADIEYLPSSWCGNSYHILSLPPDTHWTFTTPVHEGAIKTKLRIELKFISSKSSGKDSWDREELAVYSNEYEGCINPGQFWRKQEYTPQGIMDPYNE